MCRATVCFHFLLNPPQMGNIYRFLCVCVCGGVGEGMWMSCEGWGGDVCAGFQLTFNDGQEEVHYTDTNYFTNGQF